MQVVILAGGLATRLGDLTEDHPKSLLKFQGKPFLEYQLELLRRADIGKVVLCLGHLGEQIERHFGDGNKFGVSICYSIEEKPLGTAGALRNARDMLDDTFFCMYGNARAIVTSSAVTSFKSPGAMPSRRATVMINR